MAFDPRFSLLNQTFTIPVLSLAAEAAQKFAVAGAAVGMGVVVNPRASSAFAPFLYGYVDASNEVTVAYRALVSANLSATSIAIDIHVLP